MDGQTSRVALARAVADALESGEQPAALATVVGRSGSAPQVQGARMLVYADGTTLGTVGGGAIEALVLDVCRQAIADGESRLVESNLVRDLGMCCGGSMQVFVERIARQSRLFIIGAGHVSQALAPVVRTLDLRVIVLDDRDELLGDSAFEGCETMAYDADEVLAATGPLRSDDMVFIVTRDHARDEKALAELLGHPLGYLGMIGSRRKVHRVLARVLRRYDERNLPRPALGHVRAPVGLALGGRTPAEIAVSVAAEIVAFRSGGDGSAMSIVGDVVASLDERKPA